MNNIKCPYCLSVQKNIKGNKFTCYLCGNSFIIKNDNKIIFSKIVRRCLLEIILYTSIVPVIYFISLLTLLNYNFLRNNSLIYLSIFGIFHPFIFFISDIFRRDRPILFMLYLKAIQDRGTRSFKIKEKLYFYSSFLIFCLSIILLIGKLMVINYL